MMHREMEWDIRDRTWVVVETDMDNPGLDRKVTRTRSKWKAHWRVGGLRAVLMLLTDVVDKKIKRVRA